MTCMIITFFCLFSNIFGRFSKQLELPALPLFHLVVMAVQKVVNEVAFVLKSLRVVKMALTYTDRFGEYSAGDVVNELWVAMVCSFLLELMAQHM